MNYIQKIITQGAGVESSNGEYVREEGGLTWFYSDNGSHIENTVDGWYLIDSSKQEQTYLFNDDFTSVVAVGDAIAPVPTFEVVYSED